MICLGSKHFLDRINLGNDVDDAAGVLEGGTNNLVIERPGHIDGFVVADVLVQEVRARVGQRHRVTALASVGVPSNRKLAAVVVS